MPRERSEKTGGQAGGGKRGPRSEKDREARKALVWACVEEGKSYRQIMREHRIGAGTIRSILAADPAKHAEIRSAREAQRSETLASLEAAASEGLADFMRLPLDILLTKNGNIRRAKLTDREKEILRLAPRYIQAYKGVLSTSSSVYGKLSMALRNRVQERTSIPIEAMTDDQLIAIAWLGDGHEPELDSLPAALFERYEQRWKGKEDDLVKLLDEVDDM